MESCYLCPILINITTRLKNTGRCFPVFSHVVLGSIARCVFIVFLSAEQKLTCCFNPSALRFKRLCSQQCHTELLCECSSVCWAEQIRFFSDLCQAILQYSLTAYVLVTEKMTWVIATGLGSE